MDGWRLDRLVERVVAWHNRDPFAARITAADVHAVGYVAMPFAADADGARAPAPAPIAGASLRETARARQAAVAVPIAMPADDTPQPPPAPPPPPAPATAPRRAAPGAARPLFAADWLDAVPARRLARWAIRHASPVAPQTGRGPLRRIGVDPALPPHDGRIQARYAMTAAIVVDGRRTRILAAAGGDGAVIGRRLRSRPRAIAAAAVFAVATVASVLLAASERDRAGAAAASPPAHAAVDPAPGPVLALPAPAIGPPAVAVAPVPPMPPVPPVAAVESPTAAAAPDRETATVAPDPSAAAAKPLDVEPRLGRIELPPIVPQRRPAPDERRRAATADGPPARDRAAPGDAAATAATATATATAATAATAAAATVAPTAAAWALATPLLRTRTESQQVARAIDELLRDHGSRGLRVERQAVGDDWRVVGWPFAARGDAERARALLVARGLRVEIVAF